MTWTYTKEYRPMWIPAGDGSWHTYPHDRGCTDGRRWVGIICRNRDGSFEGRVAESDNPENDEYVTLSPFLGVVMAEVERALGSPHEDSPF